MDDMKFGIEHEVALVRNGKFLDFSNTSFDEMDSWLKKLPVYGEDRLRKDRLGIMEKRWYVEGYERFTDDGKLASYLPKGIEIRTNPEPTIARATDQLKSDYGLLEAALRLENIATTWISYHPYRGRFVPAPPFSRYELEKFRESPDDSTAHIAQLSFGPDLSVSLSGLSDERIIDLGRKLIALSPFLIPYSFSSPFYRERLWPGLSVRTYIRSGRRQAVRVFVRDAPKDSPPFVQKARFPGEIGRIEFKSFDSCQDPALYASLLSVLKGLLLDKKLTVRANAPDLRLHRLAALKNFGDGSIKTGTLQALEAAKEALINDPDISRLDPLFEIVRSGKIPGQILATRFSEIGSIAETLNLFPSLILS
ncbi:MAG: glutamate--cysteine ligase [Candidatus Saccharibacteria bacterium]